MRKFFLPIFAAVLFGLALPTGANAARGDFDFPGNGYRYYSGSGVGVYWGYGPRYRTYRTYPRRYYYRSSPSINLYIYPSRPRSVYRSGSRCSYWSQRCGANWGYNNANYRGCMRYYKCR